MAVGSRSNPAGSPAHCPGDMYKRLDPSRAEIRLLTIDSGREWSRIRGHMEVASLHVDLPRKYETISYCWGNSQRFDTIELNGHAVQIPLTAVTALRKMRLASQPRTLWIDSVCINQSDSREKSSQVASMDKIYHAASGNLVWLGKDRRKRATRTLLRLGRVLRRIDRAEAKLSKEARGAWFGGDTLSPDDWDGTNLVSIEDIEELKHLYTLPWFTRLWVVQEAILARSNQCYWGDITFPLQDALKVASLYWHTSWDTENSEWVADMHAFNACKVAGTMWFFTRPGYRDRLDGGVSAFSWHIIHRLATTLNASDGRDHVFALSGLVRRYAAIEDQHVLDLIAPDYNRSVENVFRDATRAAVMTEGDWILSRVQHKTLANISNTKWPSWTTMWHSDNYIFEADAHAGHHPDTENATTMTLDISSGDDNALCMKGFMVDWVEHTGSDLQSRDRQSEVLFYSAERLHRIVAEICSAPPWNTTRTSAAERCQALAAVLTCGTWAKGFLPYDDLKSATRAVGSLLRVLHRNPYTNLREPLDKERRLHRRIYDKIHVESADRTIFRSSTGHLGSGPALTRPGDVIFIIEGGSYPYILRPKEDHYLLVGAAYVYELMDGEVYSAGIESEWITIR